MNGQSNSFNFNRDPKEVPKRSGNSINDFNQDNMTTKSDDTNKVNQPNKVNLNPMNSEKMNSNPNNIKTDPISMRNTPIMGSNNTDSDPINPGMIQASSSKQNQIHTDKDASKQPSFSKTYMGGMKNPVDAFIDEANSTTEKIQPLDAQNTGYHSPEDTAKERKNIRKIIMLVIMIGLVVEIVVLAVAAVIKNTKVTYVTCTNSNNYDYYKATIKSERVYSLKKDKIIKLEEKIDYVFGDSAEYLEYKNSHMDPPYADISGRSVMTSVNDDTLTYTEKIIYDYNSLLKNNKNTSKDSEYISIDTGREDDSINLVNTNAQGIKTYHKDTYTCK